MTNPQNELLLERNSKIALLNGVETKLGQGQGRLKLMQASGLTLLEPTR